MKQLVCEMCNSTDMVKQDGLFVCQYCGCKYTVEEARKMMIEGTVEVSGVVKVDDSEELKRLYLAARNAREISDDAGAAMYYETILSKDPNSWEAIFYGITLKTSSIKNAEIAAKASGVITCLPKVFSLINTTVDNEADKKKAVKEVSDKCFEVASWLTGASNNFYKTLTKGNGLLLLTGIGGLVSGASSTLTALNEDIERCAVIAGIMKICGDQIELVFGLDDKDYHTNAIWCWQKVLDFNARFKQFHSVAGQSLFNSDFLESVKAKIPKTSAPSGDNKLEKLYRSACAYAKGADTEELVRTAAALFEKASGYQDTDEKRARCLEMIALYDQRNALGIFQTSQKKDLDSKISALRMELIKSIKS